MELTSEPQLLEFPYITPTEQMKKEGIHQNGRMVC